MVNRLLFLARHDAEGGRVFRKVDLSILLEDLISDIEWLCEEKELSIVLNSFEGCLVQGDDVTLRQLFFNLIDNAIHTHLEMVRFW
jgi:signal transduction histidine kinase